MKKVLCVICALGMLITAAFSVMTFTASAAGDINLLDESKIDSTATKVQYSIGDDGTWTLTATEAGQEIGIAGPGEYKSADGTTYIAIELSSDVPFSVSLFDAVNSQWINFGGDFGSEALFTPDPEYGENAIKPGEYTFLGTQINLTGCYTWGGVDKPPKPLPETLAITSIYINLRAAGELTIKTFKLTDGILDPDPNAPKYEEYATLMPNAETPSEPGNTGNADIEFAAEGKAFTVTVKDDPTTHVMWPAVVFDIDDVEVNTEYCPYLHVKGSGVAGGNFYLFYQVEGEEYEIQLSQLLGLGKDIDSYAVDQTFNLLTDADGMLGEVLDAKHTTTLTITKIRVSSYGNVDDGFTWEDIAIMKEEGVEVPTTATTTSTDSTSTDSSTSDTTTSTDSSLTETTTTKTDTPEPGDINRDGKPNTVEDAYDLYLATSGKVALDPIAKAVADICADGEVDTIDAYFLYLRVAGLAA